MYDAIVIGARCAGASTALLSARKGYRTLLLDRARFPSDIPHGHFIHQEGPARLHRWGLLDAITASGCPRIDSAVSDMGDFPLQSSDICANGVGLGYGPRRKVLDALLVEAAVAAGVELRESCSFEGVVTEGDRVVGIRGRTAQGTSFEERARITIGADGRGSRLARIVQAPSYEAVPTLSCYVFSYWSGVGLRSLNACARPRRAVFAFPTNDDLFVVFVGAPIEEVDALRADMPAFFDATLAAIPALDERLRAGKREERFYAAADLPNFYRKPYGPGWALVGDAGCHKDPYRALGLHDAFRDADLLSEAVDAAFSGRASFDEALASYESRRNEASLPAYRDNLNAARYLPPPPEQLALRAALRGDPENTRAFFMAYFGVRPRDSFFNPENLQRLTQRAV
jgi:flavin-dependent dehydrogenase